MREYELMFIVEPLLLGEQLEPIKTRIKEIIAADGGEIASFDEWGKRKLAYPIKKTKDGIYLLCKFKSAAPTINVLDKYLKHLQQLLRFRIILTKWD